MMSIRSLTDFIESVSWSVPWLVELPPSPVRGHCGWILNEGRGLLLATSGDFSWPPAETSVGHQWILSHGHGHRHHRTNPTICIPLLIPRCREGKKVNPPHERNARTPKMRCKSSASESLSTLQVYWAQEGLGNYLLLPQQQFKPLTVGTSKLDSDLT